MYDKKTTYGLTGETLNEDLGVLVYCKSLISRRTKERKSMMLVGRDHKANNVMLLMSTKQHLLMRMFLIVSS